MRRRPRSVVVLVVVGLACGDDAGPVPTAELRSIDIAPAATLPVGVSLQLAAIGSYADGTTADLTTDVAWISSAASIAEVSQAGVLEGKNAGDARITATLGNTRATMQAVVEPAALLSARISTPRSYILVGEAIPLLAEGLYTDGTVHAFSQPTWRSDRPEHIEVTPEGFAQAVAVGDAYVTATSGAATTPPVLMTGFEQDLLQISIDGAPFITSLGEVALLGHSMALTARGFDFVGGGPFDVTSLVTWSSSRTDVATIDANGLLTPVSRGLTVVTADRAVRAFLLVRVVFRVIQSLSVRAPLVVFQRPDFVGAVAVLEDGSLGDITRQVTWTSSDPAIATISNARGSKGLVTPHGAGQTDITATIDDKSATTIIVVEPAPP